MALYWVEPYLQVVIRHSPDLDYSQVREKLLINATNPREALGIAMKYCGNFFRAFETAADDEEKLMAQERKEWLEKEAWRIMTKDVPPDILDGE